MTYQIWNQGSDRLNRFLRQTTGVLSLALLSVGLGCSGEEADLRFVDPATTFKTYQQAVADRDLDLLWSCYSTTYKDTIDQAAWTVEWEAKSPDAIRAELRLEIIDEQKINQKIGYLLMDPTTLESPQVSPFFYFLHEEQGWKITTYLDSVFHHELEQAIARGEYSLPTF
ncbi:MAG: hypothetical protein GKR89_31090 [Candidatus Latescibacteria bacterium]|nr:hypothetical protein [Candidatus Latescibacterota bacterium]